jgi:cytochrome bd ubiquinol oxidase subunit I
MHNNIPRAVIDNFWDVLLNPSSLDRLTHVLLGCWLSGAFLVLSVSAFYILKKRHLDFAKKSLKIGLIVATISTLLQLFSGDSTARGVAINQPIKLAAFEGVYETKTPTGMFLFGIVDKESRQVSGIQLPGLLSFLVYRNFKKPIVGLDHVPADMTPNVPVVFQTYHLMIFMWALMFLAVCITLIALYRKKITESHWILKFLIISVLFPQIANQAGWFSAEMGRQPWVVQGLLKTQDGASPLIKPSQVIASLTLFSLIYLLLFILFIFLMNKKIQEGPIDELATIEYRDTFEEAR